MLTHSCSAVCLFQLPESNIPPAFHHAAKAESIRLTLAAAGVEFENQVLTFDDMPAVKKDPAAYPFGQIPR